MTNATSRRKANQDMGAEVPAFVHRRVSASGLAAPATSAARSVFDIARDAEAQPAQARGTGRKARLPPLDVAAIAVERGVPMPSIDRGKQSRYAPLLEKLTEPGLSVVFPRHYHGAVATAARAWAKAHGMKFTLRKTSDDECRLWRVS